MGRTRGAREGRERVQDKLEPGDPLIHSPAAHRKPVADLDRRQPTAKEISPQAMRQKILLLERRMEALTAEIILERQVVSEQVTPVIQYLERTIRELQTRGHAAARLYNRLMVVPRFKRKLARARGVLADAAAGFLQEHARSEAEKQRLERDVAENIKAEGNGNELDKGGRVGEF